MADEMIAGQAVIDDDYLNTRVILQEMIKAHQGSASPSRERSLVITKLQEALMWATEGLARS